MALLAGAGGAPIATVSRRLGEEQREILGEGRLIVFGQQQVAAASPVDAGAKPALGMQGIGTDDASFDPHRGQKLRDDAQFILFLARDLLFEQQARLRLIEG